MSDARGLPGDDTLIIHFAHVAYRLAERFALRRTGIGHFQTWSRDETLARISEGHVLVMSGFWSDEMLEQAMNAEDWMDSQLGEAVRELAQRLEQEGYLRPEVGEDSEQPGGQGGTGYPGGPGGFDELTPVERVTRHGT